MLRLRKGLRSSGVAKMNDFEKTLIVVLIIMCSILISLVCVDIHKLNGYEERLNMQYDVSEQDIKTMGDQIPILEGYYSPKDKFYCVWIEGETLDDIQKTDTHELCHALVDNDYEHFCGEV